ncbi:MAG: hypothetical protein IPJ75_10520 [Ignavibacteriales bacterium]|nr:hypothetical protein [Ignavibacteriales bacterium]
MENEEVNTSVMSQFDKIVSFDTSIFREPKFSLYQYENVESIISIFQDLVKQLSEVDDYLLFELPNYDGVNSLFLRVQGVIEKITRHSGDGKSSPDNAKVFKQEITSCYRDLLNDFTNLTVFLFIPKSAENISSIKDKLDEMDAIVSKIEAKDKEAEELIKVISRRVADVDVSRYSTKFKDSSEQYKSSAIWWLVASVALFGLTLGILFGYNWLFPLEANNDTYEIVRYLSTKILILTLLISGTLWCAKIYKVNKNLSVVYEHKSNSLDSFTEFVNSA